MGKHGCEFYRRRQTGRGRSFPPPGKMPAELRDEPSGTVPPEDRGTRSVAGERRKSAVQRKNHAAMKAGAPRMARLWKTQNSKFSAHRPTSKDRTLRFQAQRMPAHGRPLLLYFVLCILPVGRSPRCRVRIAGFRAAPKGRKPTRFITETLQQNCCPTASVDKECIYNSRKVFSGSPTNPARQPPDSQDR